MAAHPRTCHLCEAGCGLLVEIDGDRVVSVRGDADDPLSQGYICPKATAIQDIHHDPDRLRRPLARDASGALVEVEWDAALDRVADALRSAQRAHGPDAVGVYQGNPTVHSLGLMTWGQVLWRNIGTRNLFSAASADQLPHQLASWHMLGSGLMLPVPDIDRTDHLLIIGANPLDSNGSLMTAPDVKRRLKAIRGRGRVVVVDPRRTRTAAAADEWVAIRPGGDAALLLGMLHVVLAERTPALHHLAGSVEGLGEIRRLAADYPPARVTAAAGVPAETIRRLALDLADADRGVCYGRLGVCTQAFGGLAAWLVNVLNIVTGHFDRAGGVMFPRPAVNLQLLTRLVGMPDSFDRYRSPERDLPEFAGEFPLAILADAIERDGPDRLRALVVSAGNPVLSAPNGARLERALSRLDCLVAITPYLDETARLADVVLPPTWGVERDHYDLALAIVQARNAARWSPALLERGSDQRHDWEIALGLMARLKAGRLAGIVGALAGRVTPRAIVDLGLRAGPYPLSVRTLEAHPHGLDLGALEPRLPDALPDHRRRIDLAPRAYLDDVPRLMRWIDAERDDGLVLIGRRHLRSNNSWMHNTERLMKGPARCTLQMHPDDAEARGITDGATVAVESRVGRVEVAAEVTADLRPGVVSLPHGFGHHRKGVRLRVAARSPGVSVNDLTDDAAVDAISGTAVFNGVPVEVRPVG